MLHDVGFIDAYVELNGLATHCFAVREGFIFFVWSLCGVLLGVLMK